MDVIVGRPGFLGVSKEIQRFGQTSQGCTAAAKGVVEFGPLGRGRVEVEGSLQIVSRLGIVTTLLEQQSQLAVEIPAALFNAQGVAEIVLGSTVVPELADAQAQYIKGVGMLRVVAQAVT